MKLNPEYLFELATFEWNKCKTENETFLLILTKYDSALVQH